MIKISKIAAVALLFSFIALVAIADRGGFGRRNKINFNIVTVNNLKNSVAFNLKSGLKYRGNTVLNRETLNGSVYTNSILKYQKGNSIYILPYKQKILSQSYSTASGYKLIIRSK